MEFECPVCGAKLHHERVDDGTIINEVADDGTVEIELVNISNGFDRVYCSEDSNHNIADDVVFEVICLA